MSVCCRPVTGLCELWVDDIDPTVARATIQYIAPCDIASSSRLTSLVIFSELCFCVILNLYWRSSTEFASLKQNTEATRYNKITVIGLFTFRYHRHMLSPNFDGFIYLIILEHASDKYHGANA